ncbi:MAG TPA: DUF3568 family protein [Gemmatimonadales bacterium]|nr:DUF3568 family protein [Gemmatimonadales bacterium]
MSLTARGLWTSAVIAGTAATGGCILAAAGAGAGGAVYVGDRGVESVVAAPVDRVYEASRQAFKDLGIAETKTSSEQDGGVEKRTLAGTSTDRKVTASLRSQGTGTHVEVVVEKTAVTWDKKFAKRVMEKVVALAK